MESRKASIRLGRQFSIVMLLGSQLFVCWLSLLLWKGLYSFTEATINMSQFVSAVALIVASVIWRKWYLVSVASGVMIDWIFRLKRAPSATRWSLWILEA